MLQLVKYVDIDIVYRALFHGQLGHAMVIVIFFGKFQDGLVYRFGQPDHGFLF